MPNNSDQVKLYPCIHCPYGDYGALFRLENNLTTIFGDSLAMKNNCLPFGI